uniref:FAST_1 domain-containing protein n=1 Tax=Biomphalaria glabrata TaxID=6526 RepID=A0A182YU14_BIOGL
MSSLNPHRFLCKPKETLKAIISSLNALCCQTLTNSDYNHQYKTQSLLLKGHVSHRKEYRCYSTDSSSFKVLTESTMLVQDGINIEELPILIRRATRNSFPFTSHSYTGEKVSQETEFDNTFRYVLQSCTSVNDIFRLLEVPSDKVRGYSAAFALQRLHILKHLNTDWNQIHSFIRSAVMRELYDTVEQDIGLLANTALISLVDCYIAAEGFSPSCLNAVNTEVQIRLGEGQFSIEELLTLACILKSGTEKISKDYLPTVKSKLPPMSIVSENASRFLSNDDQDTLRQEHFDKYCARTGPEAREEIKAKCEELSNNVWVHLFSRYKELNEETFPSTLQALPFSYRSMVTFLEKPLNHFWVKLTPDSVAISLKNLLHLRTNNSSIMINLSRWAYVHIHKMTPPLMLSFLNTFLQFNFVDENLFKVIERCLQLKGLQVQTSVIAMCVEYSRYCRYLSPLIMDAAANHFTHYGYSYEPLQLYAVLRAFGQLNYLPSQPEAFLKMVESCLWDRFDHLNEAHLLEILASFTFINILPKNFSQRVASDYYFAKVSKLKSPDKTIASTWLKVMKHAIVMEMSNDPQKCLTWLLSRNSRGTYFMYHDSYKNAAKSVKFALNQMFGPKFHHSLPFYGCHTINLDNRGAPVEFIYSQADGLQNSEKIVKKLALLLRSADHFITNTKQLLGVQVQRVAHLKKLGYIPLEIRVSDILFAERISEVMLVDVVRQHLQPHVNFDQLPEVCGNPLGQVEPFHLEQSLSDWLGYDDLLNQGTDDVDDFDLIKALLKSKSMSDQMKPDPDDPHST